MLEKSTRENIVYLNMVTIQLMEIWIYYLKT